MMPDGLGNEFDVTKLRCMHSRWASEHLVVRGLQAFSTSGTAGLVITTRVHTRKSGSRVVGGHMLIYARNSRTLHRASNIMSRLHIG